GEVASKAHLLVAGTQRAQAVGVGVAWVGIAEVDDALRGEALLVRAGAVEVIIDQARAVRLAARRDILTGKYPDTLGHTQWAEVEIPVRRAVDFLVKRREFPEVKGVVHRGDLPQQSQQWMVRDFFEAVGGLGALGEMGRGPEP